MTDTMRLDRFLWFARLTKTRPAAQAIAADGHLRIDGRPTDRAHAAIRPGNILTFAQGATIRVIRIESLPVRRGPAPEARACYIDLVPGTGGGNAALASAANESQHDARD